MNTKLNTWVLSNCLLIGALVSSCLMPPQTGATSAGTTGKGHAFEKACVKATKKLQVMHTRHDIAWPTAQCRARAAQLVEQMTLEEKIGQMIQPDRNQLRDDYQVLQYGFGSVINGGDSDPPSNSASDWAHMVHRIHTISLESRLQIPTLYGTDAVHGHNNVQGAVVFPHNIGLGCTRNPELVRRIGRVTAEEVAATGIDWAFAPVFAATRNERWGRTYEAFGETPELAAELGKAMVIGLQGDKLGKARPSVLASAKHFAGDGGTLSGIDRGHTVATRDEFLRLHVSQYKAAIEAGVGSIMVSFSAFNGAMMHCNGELLTDLLKGEMGFNGIVVSDWGAVELTPGGYETQLANGINAGLDMVMAPKSYRQTVTTLKELIPKQIPMSRIDDAVGRIISVKCELGMFDPGHYLRDRAGNIQSDPALLSTLGSDEHRAVAREAVRKSLVLLKNKNDLLPLSKNLPRIHVAGKNAHNLGNQCGGWTIHWRGAGGAITKGTTIFQAIEKAVATGSTVTYSMNGADAQGANLGIVVVGERPYAEWFGDSTDLSLDDEDVEVIDKMKASGMPVVVVIVSGRPLILGASLDKADAVLAAWLPGTEGQGVSDVIFGDYAPTGKLSVSWPRDMKQIPVNVGDAQYDPLFPYGFGLTYNRVVHPIAGR